VEPQISANLADGARARQVAESGIEWGFNQLSGRDFNDPALLGTGTVTGGVNCGTGITCKVLGLTTVAGSFTVTLRNDFTGVPGDQALIGGDAATNPRDGSATTDNNKMVILKSTGTFNGASRTIPAVIQRGNGILVVEDSDLAFFQTGQFRWNGIILVTGRNNSTAFLGTSNTEIRGALIVNETNPLEVSGFSEFAAKTNGTMRILSSMENINRALMAQYNMRVSAFREN
jgi:hypothetical protein